MTLHSISEFSRIERPAKSIFDTGAMFDSGFRDNTLLECFNCHFEALPANNLERIRAAQRIRYQVYCIEHPHENSDNPDGLEMDEFDAHAAQSLLVHRAANATLGTVRLILPLANDAELSFPVQRVLDGDSLAAFRQLPLHSTGEVSRFSISREFRRVIHSCGSGTDAALAGNSAVLMRLGLIQALVRMSMERGITHWCAAMEPTLLRMLSAMAIRFRPIGPLIEYHGLRQPCYCVVADVLEDVKRERPAFWSVLTDGGALLD
ncbi:MAG TPA: PEP-CTERM/exosortase system-associated acyltransferase [Micropepsaceae bacterium]|nr:PEP-CTERM/exosortase system-associated acyltransferase [Micropepsaceae bacterium]